jgi:hypothetical protein
VRFVSDGRAPEGFKAASLADAVRIADSQVAALYPPSDPAWSTAELMYAIYPWRSGGRIFEVTQTPHGLLARSIENLDESFEAQDLDGLVRSAAEANPDPSEILFQWVKPVRDLSSAD